MLIGIHCAVPAARLLERSDAMIAEADSAGLKLIWFDDSGLEFGSRSVQGYVRQDGEWRQKFVDLPSAVIRLAAGSAESTGALAWLRAHTAVVATDLPTGPEELIRQLLAAPKSGELFAQTDDDRPAVFRCRVRLNRSAEGGWFAEDILPSGADRLAPTADIRSRLREAFPDSYRFAESHLKYAACEAAAGLEDSGSAIVPALQLELSLDGNRCLRLCGVSIADSAAERFSAALSHAVRLVKTGRGAGPFRPLYASNAGRPTVGLLTGIPLSRVFLETCHHVANSYDARFYYFYPQQIDAERQSILGSYWEEGKWLKANFPYPDVVYDRLKRQVEHAAVYEALAPLPITHRLDFKSLGKLKVYRAVARQPDLSASVIPFVALSRQAEAFDFAERYPQLILKPFNSSRGQRIITTTRTKDGWFELFDQKYYHRMNQKQFHQLLAILGKHHYVAQQFVNSKTREGFPFHVRVHLMKDGTGRWKIIYTFPSFSLTTHRKITNHKLTSRGASKWEWFLDIQFGELPDQGVDRKVKQYAYKLAEFLERWLGDRFQEIGIDLGFDEERNIRLFEANLGCVGTNFHGYEAAKHGIEYALYLASGKSASQISKQSPGVLADG